MKKLLLSIFIFPSICSLSQKFNSSLLNLSSFSKKFLFEKVYLHTDKEIYNSNENIWYSAYLLNAQTLKPDTIKQILFVELVSFEKKIIFAQKIFINKGFGNGNLFIPDTLPKGFYQIRAFTNSMKNFSPRFFFTKTIYINSNIEKYSHNFYHHFKKIYKHKNKILFRYNIESENIIEQQPCNIICYASNIFNKPLKVKIQILNNKRKIITEKKFFCCDKIHFSTKNSKKFYLKIHNKNKTKKIRLPKPQKNGIFFLLKTENKKFVLKFFSNKKISKDSLANTFLIIAENNGKIYFKKFINIKFSDSICIDKTILPAGIFNLHIIDKDGHIIQTRPFFNDLKQKKYNWNVSVRKDTLLLSFKSKNIQSAIFSLSITDQRQKFANINAYMNFFSEISNKIQFNDSIYSLKYQLLDNILLLNKIHKYNINKILNKNFPEKKYLPKKTNTIEGFANKILEKIPAKNTKLKLYILNTYNDVYKTQTDKNGKFKFSNLNYPDTVEFLIKSTDEKRIGIKIKNYDSTEIFFYPNLNKLNFNEVKKNTRFKKSSLQNISPYSGLYPSQIISGKEIESTGTTNILDALKGRIPGYQLNNNEASFVRNTTYNSYSPLYLLDNVPVDAQAISDIDPHNIERIEIIKNASGMGIYGKKAVYGIIAVYTKQGHLINWGKLNGKITGISYPKKFKKNLNSYKNQTFLWIPNLKIKNGNIILKIPLKHIKESFFINIQGMSKNGQFISLKKHLIL